MIVYVRLSAALAQVAGVPRVALTLPEGATVADLLTELRQQYPLLESRLATALPFVGGSHAAATDVVTGREEVALLLPAAGGAGSSRRPQVYRRLACVAPDVPPGASPPDVSRRELPQDSRRDQWQDRQ